MNENNYIRLFRKLARYFNEGLGAQLIRYGILNDDFDLSNKFLEHVELDRRVNVEYLGIPELDALIAPSDSTQAALRDLGKIIELSLGMIYDYGAAIGEETITNELVHKAYVGAVNYMIGIEEQYVRRAKGDLQRYAGKNVVFDEKSFTSGFDVLRPPNESGELTADLEAQVRIDFSDLSQLCRLRDRLVTDLGEGKYRFNIERAYGKIELVER